MDGQFAFSEEQHPDAAVEDVWRVLAVDDDGDFQRATASVLRDIELLGGRVELIQAFSCSEAEKLLANYKDIALVMFDVVMETEEAGLRGAKAFARDRMKEFSSLPTYAFNMDCIYMLDDIHLLETDLNGSVRMDAEATELLCSAAREENLPDKKEPIAFLTGGTDAAELAEAGARAVSILAMKWGNDARASAYHTPADTVESIEPAAVEAVIRLGVRFAEKLDALA